MNREHAGNGMSRRGFLKTAGVAAAVGTTLSAGIGAAAQKPMGVGNHTRVTPSVRGAFLYPPTESLRKVGYYSWPGSTFDAEGRHREYTARIREIEKRLGIRIEMEKKPLAEEADVARFVEEVKSSQPDGLLLIPLKKGHWTYVTRIVEETGIPSVILATLGILLVDHIRQLYRKPGVYLISSQDNFDAVEWGMRMVRAGRWMRESRILNIVGSEPAETTIPVLETQIRTIPHERFYEVFQQTEATAKVRDLAKAYSSNAREIVQPTQDDILDAAKCYFVLRQLIAEEEADALMMECLAGLRKPHKHVPPCMGFMTLRDEGIPAGCQADLNATLTLLLVQYLFDRPGFQQNASMDTERNHYFGAHCTSPSKMNGPDAPAEPYVLMNHAEAGWGCVPRVLFKEGQDVTMALYLSGDTPQMIVYTGNVIRCPSIPPTGGCRTNIEMRINEVEDVCDTLGMHQAIFYGDHGEHLRDFCQLYNIPVLT